MLKAAMLRIQEVILAEPVTPQLFFYLARRAMQHRLYLRAFSISKITNRMNREPLRKM